MVVYTIACLCSSKYSLLLRNFRLLFCRKRKSLQVLYQIYSRFFHFGPIPILILQRNNQSNSLLLKVTETRRIRNENTTTIFDTLRDSDFYKWLSSCKIYEQIYCSYWQKIWLSDLEKLWLGTRVWIQVLNTIKE